MPFCLQFVVTSDRVDQLVGGAGWEWEFTVEEEGKRGLPLFHRCRHVESMAEGFKQRDAAKAECIRELDTMRVPYKLVGKRE